MEIAMSLILGLQLAVYAVVAVAFVGGLIYYISRRRVERESETFERRDN